MRLTQIDWPATIAAPTLANAEAAADWVSQVHAEIDQLRLEHGAVRLTGLPLRDPRDFAVLRDRLIERPSVYVEKATPRSAFGHGVFSSTDFPAQREIRLHNENSYATEFPTLLLFGCLVAPVEGGATTFGDMRAMMRLLPQPSLDRFRSTGWRLARTYWGHLGLPWQTAFDTDNPAVVEQYARTHDMSVHWTGDRLSTCQIRSAIVRHPQTGDECWFNHAAFWSEWTIEPEVRELLLAECGAHLPYRTLYGDGEPIQPDTVAAINAAYDDLTNAPAWRAGDLLLVDNVRLAHGRQPFRGDRSILVAMGDPVNRRRYEVFHDAEDTT